MLLLSAQNIRGFKAEVTMLCVFSHRPPRVGNPARHPSQTRRFVCTVCTAYDRARFLHTPAGLIDGSTCDIHAKTLGGAECGQHSGTVGHQPQAKRW